MWRCSHCALYVDLLVRTRPVVTINTVTISGNDQVYVDIRNNTIPYTPERVWPSDMTVDAESVISLNAHGYINTALLKPFSVPNLITIQTYQWQ